MKFFLGRTHTIEEVKIKIENDREFEIFLVDCMNKYEHCKWGCVSNERKTRNYLAIKNNYNDTIYAKYIYKDGTSVCVGTIKDVDYLTKKEEISTFVCLNK